MMHNLVLDLKLLCSWLWIPPEVHLPGSDIYSCPGDAGMLFIAGYDTSGV